MISGRRKNDRLLLAATAFFFSFFATQPIFGADKIRIAYTSPGPQHGVLWVGDVAGVFKRNNLDLEIIYMPGNISMGSLLSGRAQFRADDRRPHVTGPAARKRCRDAGQHSRIAR